MAVFVTTSDVCPFAAVVYPAAPPEKVKVPLVARTAPPGADSAWIMYPVPNPSPAVTVYEPREVAILLATMPPNEIRDGLLLAIFSVMVEGSVGVVVQVIIKGSVESIIAPAAGEVKVRAAV